MCTGFHAKHQIVPQPIPRCSPCAHLQPNTTNRLGLLNPTSCRAPADILRALWELSTARWTLIPCRPRQRSQCHRVELPARPSSPLSVPTRRPCSPSPRKPCRAILREVLLAAPGSDPNRLESHNPL